MLLLCDRIHLLYFEAGAPRDGAVHFALVDLLDAAHVGAPISAVDTVTYICVVCDGKGGGKVTKTETEKLLGLRAGGLTDRRARVATRVLHDVYVNVI